MQNTWKVVGIVLIVVLAVLLAGGAGMMGFAGMMGRGGYGAMMGGYGFSPLGGILALVFRTLILAGVVLLIVWLVRKSGTRILSTNVPESPLAILDMRYAKGEINKDQFDSMKKDLGV